MAPSDQHEPWPFTPLAPGCTRVEIHHHNDYSSIALGVDLHGLSRQERRRTLKGPVAIAWRPMPPLMVWLVQTPVVIYDLPFSPSMNGEAWRTKLTQALCSSKPPLIRVVFVYDGVVERNYRLLIDEAAGISIALALDRCPSTLASATYDMAVDEYQARFTPLELMKMSAVLVSR